MWCYESNIGVSNFLNWKLNIGISLALLVLELYLGLIVIILIFPGLDFFCFMAVYSGLLLDLELYFG